MEPDEVGRVEHSMCSFAFSQRAVIGTAARSYFLFASLQYGYSVIRAVIGGRWTQMLQDWSTLLLGTETSIYNLSRKSC
jgi:hypothetical protein